MTSLTVKQLDDVGCQFTTFFPYRIKCSLGHDSMTINCQHVADYHAPTAYLSPIGIGYMSCFASSSEERGLKRLKQIVTHDAVPFSLASLALALSG